MDIPGRFVPSWVIAAVVLVTGVALGAGMQQIRVANAREDLATARAEHAETLRQIADKTAEAYRAVQAARDAWAATFRALDARHHQELDREQQKNDRLRADARAGAVRVRFEGARCPGPTGAVPPTAGASGVGDGAVEVGGAARETVFDLRAALIEDARKLAYLQDYASRCAALEVPQ